MIDSNSNITIPDKMKVIDLGLLNEANAFSLSDLPLNDNYVILLKGREKVCFEEMLEFSKTLGKPLAYGDKSYITFNSVFLENELHYDGISADGKYAIPDWLIFYVEDIPSSKGAEFRVMNCETVIHDIDEDVLEILKSRPLEFYGFPTFHDPDPKPYVCAFAIPTIQYETNIPILRIHLPTDDPEYVEVEDDYVYCKIDNFRLKFKDMSGKETASIFNHIRKACYSRRHLMHIELNCGDVLFMRNRYSFHGRNKCISPEKRIMHRIQTIDE